MGADEMQDQSMCPLCQHEELDVLHEYELVDIYQEPEATLQKSNDYHRNYVLFENILERSVDRVPVSFLLCMRCGLIFFSPRPDAEDLAAKYALISDRGDTLAREQKHRLVDQRARRAKQIRRTVERHWHKDTSRALDVGGADGHCLGELASDFECHLVDFEERELWPGVRKIGNTVEDLAADDLFDVVLTCHTLEHIPDIPEFLQCLVRHLADKGILYVEVPYGCAGEIYRTGNLITHINFFSEGSLGYLLEEAGLHVLYIDSRPVLSSKRYLPVVVAVASKLSSCPAEERYLDNASSITQEQISRSIDRNVTLANMRLVLSSPLAYARAFIARYFH